MKKFCFSAIFGIGLTGSVFCQTPRSTPVSVPQTPVAPKERSDLQDAGIRGQARSIKVETESYQGSNARKGRRLTRIEEFNESGNRTLTRYFRENGFSWIAYGYIDGFRVQKAGGESGGIGSGSIDPRPRDPRFEFKRIYEYQNGKLVKDTLISNAGSTWMTYAYVYRDGEKDVLVYDEKGKLNQKYKYIYDKDGNEIEYASFDAFKDPTKITYRTKYTYEAFDSVGNWIERTQLSLSTKDGVVSFTPSEKIYRTITYFGTYNPIWFAPINDPKKPDWEILPQEAKPGEVILSKRNELGILSNFAATPFVLDGKRYASVEGFWQMMLYPEGTSDERRVTRGKNGEAVVWKYTREQVAQMTAFEAKAAGTLAEENMKKLGIDWVTYNGKRFPYRSQTPGEHYRLILAAMRAKLEQNPEVRRVLLATGDLILKPDHIQEPNAPPEWKYNEIWMQLRADIMHKPARE